MTVIGQGTLRKLFPEFKEDIGENGIDLRVGEVYLINKKKTVLNGCVNENKYPPVYSLVEKKDKEHYILEPGNFYFIRVDRPIHIPKGYIQQYYPRSSFSRCGVFLNDAIGDSGFKGTLMFGLYIASPVPVSMGFNERVIQAVTMKTDGTETLYDGDYQNDKIYEGLIK